jgi:hypothetical protein
LLGGGPVFAASSTDEAVLGADRWSVDSSGYLIPNTTATYNLGSSSYRVNTIYGTTLNFGSNLIAVGYANGGVSTIATLTTTLPVSYGELKIIGSAGTTKTLPNGQAGQIIHIVCVDYISATTITPTTSTGWASASLGASGQSITVQYLDDTRGWVLQGIAGATITYKNSL